MEILDYIYQCYGFCHRENSVTDGKKMTDYNTIIDDVQTAIYNVLRTDTNSISIKTDGGETILTKLSDFKWTCGIPKELLKGTAQTYGIVHTPEIIEERHTITRKAIYLNTTIELVTRREIVVRKGADMIKRVLKDNERTTTFIGSRIVLKEITSSDLIPSASESNDIVYTYRMVVRHRFYG